MKARRRSSLPLRVGTFNTQLLPYMTSCRSRARLIAERIIERRYDLIGLSEVFSKQARRELFECLSPQYPYGVWYLGTRSRLRLDSGLMLFSKLPLDDLADVRGFVPARGMGGTAGASEGVCCVRFDEYRERCGVDGLATKGCAYVRVRVDGHALHVFLTHVQASYLDDSARRYLKTVDVRAAQIRQMRSFMNSVLGDGSVGTENVLVMGDFNVHWSARGAGYPHRAAKMHADEWQMMFDAFNPLFLGRLVDVWQRYAPAADLGLTYPAGDPATRPDYILLSAADPKLPLCAQHVTVAHDLTRHRHGDGSKELLLSDHLGVQADFHVPSPHCNIGDACVIAVDGSAIQLRGCIEYPGGVQWYCLAGAGKYQVGVASASHVGELRTDVYAEHDISRPLCSRNTGLQDCVMAREYTVPGPSYLRVGDPQASTPGEYVLRVCRVS
jgi:endonuclease/exonuclease/phosphatase family metal-dependent hydrolase